MTTRAPRPTMMGRRDLLRALGTMALLAPCVSLHQQLGYADSLNQKRILLVTFPDGLEEGWFPSGTESDFTLSPRLAALEPHRDKLLILGGLKGSLQSQLEAHKQGPASLWTGSKVEGDVATSNGPSIDQIIADRISQQSPFRALHFGSRSDLPEDFGGNGYMHHAAAAQPIPPEDNPSVMYNQLFGQSLTGDRSEELAQARAEQKSVLDFVRGRIRKLEPKLAAADRPKFQEHLAGIRAIERSIDALAEFSCDATYTDPGYASASEFHANPEFPRIVDIQSDLAVLALTCGLSPVATLQMSNTGGSVLIPGVNDEITLHVVMHDRPKAERERINVWFMERFAALLGKLDAVELSPERTLLDETLVVCSTKMGTGNHRNDPLPFFVAGGGGDHFKLGRWLKLEGQPRQTRVLTSIVHAMGLRDIEGVGEFRDVASWGPLEEVQG